MILYEDYIDHIGEHFNIQQGLIQLIQNGDFCITDRAEAGVLYLDHASKKAILIPRLNQYVGWEYNRGTSDCVSLALQWFDDMQGTKYTPVYLNTSKQRFLECYKKKIAYCMGEYNFYEVTENQLGKRGDFLVYLYNGANKNHIGVDLGNGTLLHHMPNLLSSIDTIEPDKVYKRFRHAP